MRLHVLLLSSAIILTGCANFNSIYRSKTIFDDKASLTSIDAKQRTILSVKEGNNKIKICAEQFPDVFSTISSSFSAGTEIDENSFSGRLALSVAESASTIGRTQTVNLLRESMYRTCERYLNGGINEGQLRQQAGRDQETMVTVLAIEQLTGAVTPPNARISSAALATVSTLENIVAELEAAKTKFDTAKTQENTAKTAYDMRRKPHESCDPITDESAKTSCTEAKDNYDKAKSVRETEEEHYNNLAEISKNVSQSSGAALAATLAQAQQNINNNSNASRLADVAPAVVEMVGGTMKRQLQHDCLNLVKDEIRNNNTQYIDHIIALCSHLSAFKNASSETPERSNARRSSTQQEYLEQGLWFQDLFKKGN